MNWHGDWKIPKRIHLPGVTVYVRPLPKDRQDEFDGMWVYSVERDEAYLFIDTRLPIEVQRYIVLHELQHAAVELVDAMIEKFPDHVKTRHMNDTTVINQEVVSG